MRAILVPVADRPECRAALQTAFDLARRLGADVLGCHFRAAPIEPGDWDLADLWTMHPRRAWPVPDEDAAERDGEAARRLFESQAAAAGFTVSTEPGSRERPHACWEAVAGSPPDAMPAVGGSSDLIVVSRAPEHGGEKAWIVLTSALLDSLRPVLVLPQGPSGPIGRRVAVAWNRGRTETLALHAALPIVKAADDVVLLTAGRAARGRGPTAEQIRHWLAHHGVDARAKQIDAEDEGAALVEHARAEGADVLVAGAYTRGRFREMVFGGVTEHLIAKTDLPVVLMHA
ncbi:MAG TPA: universal stress protein [Gammaproteobacteria bacterium]